jgi:DNA-binding NarL/FixJ family response regulator
MVALPETFPDQTSDLDVFVVGDDPLARHGLSTLLASEPGLRVTGQYAPSPGLADTARAAAPHVLAWDVGVNAPVGLERFRDLHPVALPALVLLPDGANAADAWVAGGRGALSRDSDGRRLALALRACAAGLVVLEERAADAAFGGGGRPMVSGEGLSPREIDVLQLLAQGLPNKLIADRLGISDHTAKFHVNAILGKLGVQSRTEAVVRAARLGLVVL